MSIQLSAEVAGLEMKCQRAIDLAGEIVATLTLNEKHFFRDDEPAKEVFRDLLQKWRKRLEDG